MRAVAFAAVIALPTVSPGAAWADGSEAYMDALVGSAFGKAGLEPESDPEGKTLESVAVVSNDVFVEGEFLPTAVNALHTTTKADVLERELLVDVGEPWITARIEESERNIRSNLHVSNARIVPAKGKSPTAVVALVVTKDIWSLRLNQNWSIVGGVLEFLELELVETNLAGRMKTVGPDFRMDQESLAWGQVYRDPRVRGSRWKLAEQARVILNRVSGKPEGGLARLSVERPLFSLDTKWAYGASLETRMEHERQFVGRKPVETTVAATGETLAIDYRKRLGELRTRVERSFGEEGELKRIASFGYRALAGSYELPFGSEAAKEHFRANVMPRSESAGLVFVGFQFYEPTYLPVTDLDSFAVTEDYRTGPFGSVEGRLASPWLGLSSSYAEAEPKVGYQTRVGDDFLGVSLSASSRLQSEVHPSTRWVNRWVQLRARNAFPEVARLRLHLAARLVRRSHDLDHASDTLGGDGALRGFPARFFQGSQLWVWNTELRSRPIDLYSIHAGFAVFADVGDALESWSSTRPHASVGAGLRVIFPQFNKEPIRVDFAIPLERVSDASYVVARFGQVF